MHIELKVERSLYKITFFKSHHNLKLSKLPKASIFHDIKSNLRITKNYLLAHVIFFGQVLIKLI